MTSAREIDRDLTDALKAHDRVTVDTLRLLKAAAKNAEVAKGSPLTSDDYVDVVRHQVKMRREAADGFERGGREESAARERAEMAVLQRYLPAQLDDAAIRTIVEQAIVETGASGPSDLGRVMSRAMPALRGRADGARVNQIARSILGEAARR